MNSRTLAEANDVFLARTGDEKTFIRRLVVS
jgi:hypothetical protein